MLACGTAVFPEARKDETAAITISTSISAAAVRDLHAWERSPAFAWPGPCRCLDVELPFPRSAEGGRRRLSRSLAPVFRCTRDDGKRLESEQEGSLSATGAGVAGQRVAVKVGVEVAVPAGWAALQESRWRSSHCHALSGGRQGADSERHTVLHFVPYCAQGVAHNCCG